MKPSGRVVLDYLDDIINQIEKVRGFIDTMDFDAFAHDEKTCYAVVRALEIVGEAAKRIPDDVRQKAPGVPWQLVAGMRDKLIHAYFGIDLEVVWRTVQEDLEPLDDAIQALIDDLG